MITAKMAYSTGLKLKTDLFSAFSVFSNKSTKSVDFL